MKMKLCAMEVQALTGILYSQVSVLEKFRVDYPDEFEQMIPAIEGVYGEFTDGYIGSWEGVLTNDEYTLIHSLLHRALPMFKWAKNNDPQGFSESLPWLMMLYGKFSLDFLEVLASYKVKKKNKNQRRKIRSITYGNRKT